MADLEDQLGPGLRRRVGEFAGPLSEGGRRRLNRTPGATAVLLRSLRQAARLRFSLLLGSGLPRASERWVKGVPGSARRSRSVGGQPRGDPGHRARCPSQWTPVETGAAGGTLLVRRAAGRPPRADQAAGIRPTGCHRRSSPASRRPGAFRAERQRPGPATSLGLPVRRRHGRQEVLSTRGSTRGFSALTTARACPAK